MADPSPEDIEWRQTGPYLWVGSHDGYHVGIIEHGRRWVAIDGRGVVQGRHKTLEDAQAALLRPFNGHPVSKDARPRV